MKRLLLGVVIGLAVTILSGCTGAGGRYYRQPSYDGYISVLTSKTLPVIKSTRDIQFP
jgi:uncharacterized lipoprotein